MDLNLPPPQKRREEFRQTFRFFLDNYFKYEDTLEEKLEAEFYKAGADGRKISDNLRKFIKTLHAGASAEEAAQATWTGRRAAEMGFTEVEDVNATPSLESLGGNYDAISELKVKFLRKALKK